MIEMRNEFRRVGRDCWQFTWLRVPFMPWPLLVAMVRVGRSR